ncbi:hypothetical protein FUT69_08840 [Xylella taiwanensis]|uniref:Toxin CptA n=1 Tax=Xylella taiwanensis TaxID=1444770 RepID=Z9JHB8_9GAMM|nr:hypothetical protein AB672_02285 [Xylella taiwanensis]EWS77539.1 hypothetical protein AF72_10275 [Xylella taiwanensis]NBI37246.1 hypothetical protein [Xylella taiwanensis]QKD99471.1 hypothetical protein PLS229_02280 [Xylella taiwanensis]
MVALFALTLLACIALVRCDVGTTLRWIGIFLVACGGAWELRCVACQPCCALLIPDGNVPALVDGMLVVDLRVSWYGPLVTVSWCVPDSRRMRLLFWPDILPAAMRRELRLVMRARQLPSQIPSMAP